MNGQRLIGRLIVINIVLLIASLIWYGRADSGIQLAIAKGNAAFYRHTLPTAEIDQTWARSVLTADAVFADLLAGKDHDFVEAEPLAAAEAEQWPGCESDLCAHVTYYNYSEGGTIEAVLNTETGQRLAQWQNQWARPGGSPAIAAKALEIAAADAGVQALLGDVKEAEQMMIPMSGWLMDNACRRQWCVDLTYHDPAGSGRVVHVFTNMAQEEVARIFYTRARPELDVTNAIPPMQRTAYSDGCTEQHGWEVCWEMTAHDGILFSEAAFQGEAVFASVKIPQVEAWYPSWPGGYRDEIGFSASVPPFGDTQVNNLGNGFEVRQLFTEFTHWPNCVCCYRYEQVMRFYDDGSFEPRFVSHGPGCDDLSVYRPFWRIDANVGDPGGDSALFWNGESWEEVAEEREFHPLVDEVAPGDAKLATVDGERRYAWSMARTDPLGLDEARLFVLRQKAEEGGGPVPAGPGDTFQPPRQWIDGESLPDNDLVVWFVPLLKTKKTEPLWCMPDPEPGINQCEAILRVEPVETLPKPSAEGLTVIVPTATATAVSTPAPTSTPRPVQGDDAEDLILNAGCGACHTIGALGEARKVGPDLTNVAAVAGERIEGLGAAEYLRQSILEPNAYITPDCPNGPCLANIMPQDYGERLGEEQVERIVQYLLSGVDAQPTPGPIGENAVRPTTKAVPTAKQMVEEEPQTIPAITIQVLLISLVALLTLFRLTKLREEKDNS